VEAVELEQPLQEEALREIERSLYGKLKAHRVSDAFINRCGEDAIQKGLLEYLRARRAGEQIQNRDAFVVRAAFCRAIDELRREARQADGAAVEGLLNIGRDAAPASEELALEQLEAQELHAALDGLSSEERQVLVLHYFERLSAKRSAELLFCSEATYRRRLKTALAALAERLGVSAPEPDSEFGVEIGLAAWAGIGGARVPIAHGPLEGVATILDRGRDGVAAMLARLRDPLARTDASGATERVGALASGPAGKVIGGCAAAALACTLGGVVGPGIGFHDQGDVNQRATRAAVTTRRSHLRPTAVPERLTMSRSGGSRSSPEPPPPDLRRADRKREQQERERSERRRVESQVSGISRAAADSTAAPEAQASAAESEVVIVSPSEGGSSSSEPAAKEFSFEQQP
jgi:RNA polymerase sigma factor (sigma-70 family)